MATTLRKGGFNLNHEGSEEKRRGCHPCVVIISILLLIALSAAAGWALMKYGVHEWYEKCKFYVDLILK
jgi:hypothetical protein